MSKPIPVALRGLYFFYHYLSPWLPWLGVALLWRLFRPHRRPLREAQAQFLAGAEAFAFTSGGARTGQPIRLQGYRRGNGPRTVLLVHGWEGSPADFRDLVPPLVAQGYTVAAFDMPAHGRSEGTETNLVEMKQALLEYTKVAGLPHAVVAHSLGGIAAALLLADVPKWVEYFVFVASPLTARAGFEVGFGPLQVPKAVRRRFFQRLVLKLGQPLEAIAFAPRADLRAKRLLGVYDTADDQAVFEPVRQYLADNAGIEQLVVSGVGHYRLLRHAPVVQRIAAFLDAPDSLSILNEANSSSPLNATA